jgi:hypothetical protein
MIKMVSKNSGKRSKKGGPEEYLVAGENWPLIQEGTYQAQCLHYQKGQSHHNAIKLFLHFKIINGLYFGKNLFMAINLMDSKTGKEFKKVPRGSKYYESWVIANNNHLPTRGDRMSPRIFKNGVYEVKTRIVRPKFSDGSEKPGCFHYTIVDHIIRRIA